MALVAGAIERAQSSESALERFADMGEHILRGRARKFRLWGPPVETL